MTERLMSERIEIQRQTGVKDLLIGYDMSYADGNRLIMIHLLWSIILYMIGLII